MNTGERNMDELPENSDYASQTPEEQRITFHRLVKRVSDVIIDQGKKARAERTSNGGSNTRPLEAFEEKVLAATLALAGQGELAEITARVNESAEKPAGDTSVFFTLSRLEGEGFITYKVIRESETEKRKVLFIVTEDGERVLADARTRAGSTEA